METPSWIRTYSGKKFYVFEPKQKDIIIEDMAHALSLLCRFTGHTEDLYSVGQHSLLVMELCPEELKLEGLTHDFPEAYITDIATPVKKQMPNYKEYENNLHIAIAKKFHLQYPMPKIIKDIDTEVFQMEWAYLMERNKKVKSGKFRMERDEFRILPPKEVEKRIIENFHKLHSERMLKIKSDSIYGNILKQKIV
jgi:5'-deoxynucleotidase YfbR-like HD superfamily hydrolase